MGWPLLYETSLGMFCLYGKVMIGMTISAAFSLVLEEQVEVEVEIIVSFIHVLHVRFSSLKSVA